MPVSGPIAAPHWGGKAPLGLELVRCSVARRSPSSWPRRAGSRPCPVRPRRRASRCERPPPAGNYV